MPDHKPARTLKLASPMGAALALVAIGAAVTLSRYAARARMARAGRGGGAGMIDAGRLRDLDADRFHRFCSAYYAVRQFHLRDSRPCGSGRDAELYFGTLPHPVAMVRSIASGSEPVDLEAIRDLADAMAQRGIAKGIVHAANGYTRAAAVYARSKRIRLVPVEHLLRDVRSMPEDARVVLSEAAGEEAGTGAERADSAVH